MDVGNAVKKQENYSKIVDWFYSQGTLDMEQMVLLVDTIGEMSEEIFEYYKALQELCKRELQRIRRVYQETGAGFAPGFLDETGRSRLAYVIEKACSLGILVAEKYEDMARDLAEGLE